MLRYLLANFFSMWIFLFSLALRFLLNAELLLFVYHPLCYTHLPFHVLPVYFIFSSQFTFLPVSPFLCQFSTFFSFVACILLVFSVWLYSLTLPSFQRVSQSEHYSPSALLYIHTTSLTWQSVLFFHLFVFFALSFSSFPFHTILLSTFSSVFPSSFFYYSLHAFRSPFVRFMFYMILNISLANFKQKGRKNEREEKIIWKVAVIVLV